MITIENNFSCTSLIVIFGYIRYSVIVVIGHFVFLKINSTVFVILLNHFDHDIKVIMNDAICERKSFWSFQFWGKKLYFISKRLDVALKSFPSLRSPSWKVIQPFRSFVPHSIIKTVSNSLNSKFGFALDNEVKQVNCCNYLVAKFIYFRNLCIWNIQPVNDKHFKNIFYSCSNLFTVPHLVRKEKAKSKTYNSKQ